MFTWTFHHFLRASFLVGVSLHKREAAPTAVLACLYAPVASGSAVSLEIPPQHLLLAPGIWALLRAVLARCFVLGKIAQVGDNLAP